MSVRNPFIVPFDKRDEVDEIRRKFCPYQSDHLTLLAAYNGWRAAKAKSRNEERQYCSKNYLSIQTLNMIYDMKKQLCVLLAEIGFLHRQYQSDVANSDDIVNQHSSNIRLVEAVIVAGLYPHIARYDVTGVTNPDARPSTDRRGKERPPKPVWMIREGRVSMHPSSVLFNERGGFDSPFLAYQEIVKTTKVYVRDATIVGSYALLLFGVDMVVQHDDSIVILDDWLSFKLKPRTATLIADLRLELRKLLVEKIQCPTVDIGGSTSSTSTTPNVELNESNESRTELRRVGPASMLQPQLSQQSTNLLSGLSNVTPSSISLPSAPDLISVVAMLLAEEEIGRKKRREAADTNSNSTTTVNTSHPSTTNPTK